MYVSCGKLPFGSCYCTKINDTDILRRKVDLQSFFFHNQEILHDSKNQPIKSKITPKNEKKNSVPTAPRVPRRSPIQVLTRLDAA